MNITVTVQPWMVVPVLTTMCSILLTLKLDIQEGTFGDALVIFAIIWSALTLPALAAGFWAQP